MSKLEAQKIANTRLVTDAMRFNGGCLPESCEEINDASREIVRLMKEETGDCWLGNINLYKDNKDQRALWQWDGGMVYNFDASFAVPAYDAELERLILERFRAPYTGCAADAPMIDKILERIRAVNGVYLHWT